MAGYSYVIQYQTGAKTLPVTIGHPESYFAMRYMWLDCRGPLTISSTAVFGFCVKIITRSHVMDGGEFDVHVVDKPVRIDDGAQVYSFSLLYNCHIKHHAVVACGSVVRNMTVEPWTMVEGNPARIVKYWDGEKWVKNQWLMRLKDDESGWEALPSRIITDEDDDDYIEGRLRHAE